ncbi:helix-turn-helix domain-containing protein [Streptomyces sp. A0592]|uniref:helix-turn-helix domain-containing protein n=1 Tax=Streptomyces sp. A0592 TaxID=2563099 RepID=UPI00144823EC|nr:helix-turn-helix domain-containing protein [Streptomyces sp. A0592]
MGANQHSNPITDADLAEIRRLHAEGHGRNEIARRLGRNGRVISNHCAAMGLTFDLTGIETATAHRTAQAKLRRAELEEKRAILADALTDDALRLSAQLWEPTVVYNFGGKDNTYEQHAVAEPPPADKRALMAAATAASAQALRLVPPETETEGMAAVDQWLRGMMGGTPAPE